jgi:hypothetical protein
MSRAIMIEAGECPVLEYVGRAYRSSEARTPLVTSRLDGDPVGSINMLARETGSRVWALNIDGPSSEQNALDYIDVGINNGDWVLLMHAERASGDFLRRMGLILFTLVPSPETAPRRGVFRLWLVVDGEIVVNDHVNPILPLVVLKNSIIARLKVRSHGSPSKLQKRLPEEPPLLEAEVVKHEQRRAAGRSSDSESDMDAPEKKPVGLWFHRAVDFYEKDVAGKTSDPKRVIFDAVDAQDTKTIEEVVTSGQIDVNVVKRDGMTPLMYAVSREKPDAIRALVQHGADITLRRERDGAPLLFMAIESEEVLNALIEAGVDFDQKYQSCYVEDHEATAPNIARIVRRLRKEGHV